MVMLEEASPLLPSLSVLGLKKANHKSFSIFCNKVTFEWDHEKPRDAAAGVMFLVPPVLPPEDLAGRVSLLMHRVKAVLWVSAVICLAPAC